MVCVIIGGFFGSIQTTAVSRNHPDPFNASIGTLFARPGEHIGKTMRSLNDLVNGVGNMGSLRSEVRRLRDQEAAMKLYSDRINDLELQIDALRKFVKLDSVPGRKRVPADIVGYYPSENRILINVGSKQGIQPMMPVITGDGLVGWVQSVMGSRCQVTLITALDRQVGAMALRNPPSIGLIRGQSSEMLALEMLDLSAPIEVGDMVVTSGLSERIPRGIPIGKVVKIEDNQEFATRRATVYPLVHIGNIREVYVLK